MQGYFTIGNGSPAPGGFVPLATGNLATISAPGTGSTSTVQVSGVAGVPTTATAVYANLIVDNTANAAGGWFRVPLPASVRIDVLGYFDGQPSNAGFTPLVTRIYDSDVSPGVWIGSGSTVDVPVNGVNGVPAYSSSISGVAMNIQALGGGAAGGVTVWPSDASMPGAVGGVTTTV